MPSRPSLAVLAVVVLLLGVTAPVVAQESQCVNTRCEAVLVQQGFPPANIPHRYVGDFDCDGIEDYVVWPMGAYNHGIAVMMSSKGEKDYLLRTMIHHTNDTPADVITGLSVVPLSADGSGPPSIVLSSMGQGLGGCLNGTYGKHPVFVIPNNNCTLADTATALPFSLVARDVDCTRLPGLQQALCYVSAYPCANNQSGYGNMLLEIDANVTATNVTKTFQLEDPLSGDTYGRAHGTFGISGAFIDYNRDGVKDLYKVAQHAYIFSAPARQNLFTTPWVYAFPGTSKTSWYHGQTDEYLRVDVPRADHMAKATIPPCVYVDIERTGGIQSDFVECYDANYTQSWYKIALPGGPYSRNGLGDNVVFWDQDGDGTVVFAAQTKTNPPVWNLLRLQAPAVCIPHCGACGDDGCGGTCADTCVLPDLLDCGTKHQCVCGPSSICPLG